MSRSNTEAVEEYFRAWLADDQTAFRALLADDVDFLGPMGQVDNAEDCTSSISRLRSMLTDIVPLHRWADGDEVITWFELHTSWTAPIPVANWSHFENGKIARIRVTFDARKFFEGMPQGQ